MTAADRRLAELRTEIPEIDPPTALRLQREGAALLDIRDPDEVSQGSPPGAVRVGRSYLELRIEEHVPHFDTPLLVLCAGGVRSLFAAHDLRQLGYARVYSVAGGFKRWKDEGLTFEVPRVLDAPARERYARHLLLPEVGEAGQLRLLQSRVLLIGAGGIGSPVALYLAAAGVGTLGVVDHDVVDRSNLQRQILHTEQRIGMAKVESARTAIEALNPGVKVVTYRERLSGDNVERIFGDFDLVVDGSDNLPTRYLVNDACVRLGRPNVHGAVYRFEGQVTVFAPALGGPCYRCLFPQPPAPELVPSCSTAGVLGVMPGAIGLLQAVETVKLLLGLGQPLIGRMMYYDALGGRFSELGLRRNPNCAGCSPQARFDGYSDPAAACSFGP